MKREAPTEREIADLFTPAFDGLAQPDARRLAAIEQRLLERPRRRAGIAWWWLAAALAVGTASALWWAVDYDWGRKQEEPVPEITSPSMAPSAMDIPTRPGRTENTESTPADGSAQKQGPLIYQRER
jgi:hypothetical protein